MCKLNLQEDGSMFCEHQGEKMAGSPSNCPGLTDCLEELHVAQMIELHAKMYQEMFSDMEDEE